MPYRSIDLRYLNYFVVVAEELNFTRAAERLHTSQPSLSVQIARLEAQVGVPLFTRGARGVALTDAGSVFLERAKRALADVDRGMSLARQAAHGEIGQLSIGYDAAAEFRIFPKLIPAVRQRWPRVHLRFQSLKNSQVLEGLRSDELDVGFVFLPITADELEVVELAKVPLVVALPEGHRLARSKTVKIADMSDEPLILFSRNLDPETYLQIEQLFRAAGARMNVVVETATLLSGINFVSMGTGCCFLGDYSQRLHWDGVVYRPLRPSLTKTVGMIKKRQATNLVESFYRFTVETVGRGS